MLPCIRAFIYRIKMPSKDLRILKRYAKNALINHKNYKDHSYTLAGQIKKGKQLLMPEDAPELQVYYNMLTNATGSYYKNYLRNRGVTHDSYKLKAVQKQHTWLNSYYEGDYNPVHHHGTISPIGLSSFTFISTPDCIKPVEHGGKGRMAGEATNALDGHTILEWGYNYSGANSINNLESAQMSSIYPEEGVTYLFPCWMSHQVYPFRGAGKRITMGTNLSVWSNKDWDRLGKNVSSVNDA